MTKKAETTFPRKPDESLVDYTLRWLADADRKLELLDLRKPQGRY